MKNTKNIITVAIGGLLLSTSLAANSSLESRLSGMAYYDTDTGLTWVAPKYTLDLGLHYSEYKDFMPTFELGGTGDWVIPQWIDFLSFVLNHANIDPYSGGSTPIPPLESWGTSIWYWAEDGLLIGSKLYPNGLSPGGLESHPFPEPEIVILGVWPVHYGDVPVVAVPEPSAHALLLAGLGILGFYVHKKQIRSYRNNANTVLT